MSVDEESEALAEFFGDRIVKIGVLLPEGIGVWIFFVRNCLFVTIYRNRV